MENYHRRYRQPAVDKELEDVKDSTLGYSQAAILKHCKKLSKNQNDEANCINLNYSIQKYYIECFEVFRDRKECYKLIRKEVEQNGQYKMSQLLLD